MEASKVYFTDFHTQAYGDSLPTKLKKLIKKAGIQDLDLEGKFVAIKLHFGELGNISYLRPNYAVVGVDSHHRGLVEPACDHKPTVNSRGGHRLHPLAVIVDQTEVTCAEPVDTAIDAEFLVGAAGHKDYGCRHCGHGTDKFIFHCSV